MRAHRSRRRRLLTLWLAFVAGVVLVFVVDRGAFSGAVARASATSLVGGGAVYLLLGCARGFTLIPSTALVLAAVPFLPPWPLFVLTLAGILVSSATVYGFAGALHLEELADPGRQATVERLAAALERYELPVIIGWSFFPLAPTDLICAVCGALRVSLWKCLVGVAIGEGAISAAYIFAGDAALRFIGWR